MAITQQERDRISAYDVREHGHIVDSFACMGRDLIDLSIRQGIDPVDVISILHGYSFQVGEQYGDREDDRKMYRRVPEKTVKGYVEIFYPGILEGSEYENMTLEKFILSGGIKGSPDDD